LTHQLSHRVRLCWGVYALNEGTMARVLPAFAALVYGILHTQYSKCFGAVSFTAGPPQQRQCDSVSRVVALGSRGPNLAFAAPAVLGCHAGDPGGCTEYCVRKYGILQWNHARLFCGHSQSSPPFDPLDPNSRDFGSHRRRYPPGRMRGKEVRTR
jgi:hypothetical protein